MRSRSFALAVFAVAILVAGCGGGPKDGGGLRPDSSQFASEWLDVTMGGMMAVPGKGPALTLSLKNTSRRPLWVAVEFTAPGAGSSCNVDKQLDVGGGGMFTCPQTSLVQDEDYPIVVHTYGDAGRTKLLETTQTQLRFGARDVAAFNELAKSLRSAEKD